MLRTLTHRFRRIGWSFTAFAALLLVPSSAHAADSTGTLLASGYWAGFWDFWGGQFKKQDSIVMFALGVGAVSIFIITRGKWKK